MPKNNVIIIGAGIAGLSAGIYAKKAGFNVTIYESHIIPGGLSTSWSRKGYLFEGGMHWLTGSSSKMPLYKIWKELKALQENNPIIVKDPFYTVINGERRLHLYRDVSQLEEHFSEYAPEDKKAIKMLCRDIRLFQPIHLVVKDIAGLKATNHAKPNLKELLAMIPAGLRFAPLANMSYKKYISKFKNNDIKALLNSIIGERYNAISLIYTLASFSTGDCGFPEGGSVRMAQNMANYFEELGGKIIYRSKVDKVEIENSCVKGITCGQTFIPADSVIVTQDTRQAVDTLFYPPLKESWINQMKKATVGEQNMFICLGIKGNLSDLPKGIVFPLEKPFEFAGLSFSELRINNYAEYKNLSPEGCTTITSLLIGNSYEFWKTAKENGTYKQKKQELLEKFIAELEQFIPQIKGNIEVTDVATPLTYERYCHTFEGSWMSVWYAGGKFSTYPSKSKTVKGLYFASERTSMPGGLPIAVDAGRRAAQYLCRDNNIKFN